jgi:two-component system, NarL family, nitrate/nitrite response regulator NarL
MKTQNEIRVVIADDHKMMLDGLRHILSKEKDMVLVGEALNGNEVMSILSHNKVDVIVLDIGMPEMDGYDTVLNVKKRYPDTKLIILSFYKDEKHIGKLLKAGVSGYIIKDRGSEELVKAIRSVIEGKEYFDAEVMQVSLKAFQNKNAGPEKVIKFSPREIDVLNLLAEGLTSKEMGKRLHISESTVETYRKNLLEKLGLANSKLLLKYAIEKGYGNSRLG